MWMLTAFPYLLSPPRRCRLRPPPAGQFAPFSISSLFLSFHVSSLFPFSPLNQCRCCRSLRGSTLAAMTGNALGVDPLGPSIAVRVLPASAAVILPHEILSAPGPGPTVFGPRDRITFLYPAALAPPPCSRPAAARSAPLFSTRASYDRRCSNPAVLLSVLSSAPLALVALSFP